MAEKSASRHPDHPNSSQRRIGSPPILSSFFCGHAQSRAYPDLAKDSAVSNYQRHQRRYLASCKINPRLATKTFLARRVLRPLGPLSRTVRHHPRLHREQSRQGRLGRSSRGLALVQLHRHLQLKWHRHSWLCSHPLHIAQPQTRTSTIAPGAPHAASACGLLPLVGVPVCESRRDGDEFSPGWFGDLCRTQSWERKYKRFLPSLSSAPSRGPAPFLCTLKGGWRRQPIISLHANSQSATVRQGAACFGL
jgi:hypothetical protein